MDPLLAGRVPDLAHPDISARVLERTLRERRRRLARNIAIYGIISLAMILLAMAQRDAQTVQSAKKYAALLAESLQAEFDAEGIHPLAFPELDPGLKFLGDRYYFNGLYVKDLSASSRVGVCSQRQPVSVFLRSAGRYVVLFDGQRFQNSWLSEADFHRQARELGFDSLLAR